MEALNSLVHVAGHFRSLPHTQRLQTALAVIVLSGLYIKLVVAPRAGRYVSFVAVLPVVAANLAMPLGFTKMEETFTIIALSVSISFMSTLKAVGLCCNRGPLVGRWSLAQMMCLYILPLYPTDGSAQGQKGRLGDSVRGVTNVAKMAVRDIVIYGATAYMLAYMALPLWAQRYVYAFILYGIIVLLMDGPAALLIGVLGMEVVPPFDKPWLSESLADFWTRRWNNTIGLTLRATIFDPLVEGSLIKPPAAATATATPTPTAKPTAGDRAEQQQQQQQMPRPSKARKLACMLATFIISGLVHELLLWYAAPVYRPGFWFAFFFVQAPLMVVEGLVLQRMKASSVRPPRLLRIAMVHLCNYITAALFFWPPLDVHNDIVSRVAEEALGHFKAAGSGLRVLAAQLGLPLSS